ncbi:hypothetical protein PN36_16040 [Candidatus Thiomargarita nelsonii]|uniref:Glutathione S-transferase n=1 Tax=Candidatus Thiomargarita nelsonii TaxID=1003181 RepID=A0A0A6P9H5_9GAMM|nr:hypothetical protein PN36_16040 [Candidatus Thiomargarita nelsonii]
MIKLYGYPKTRSTRVVWTMEEIGVEYEYVKTSPLREARRSSYLELNPGAKVPTLVDGELVLSESAAICTYLADKYPDAGLVPKPRTAERALYDKWCFFVMTELEQPLWTIFKHQFILPKKWRVSDIIDTALWEFSEVAKVLNIGLGDNEFIVGGHFSVADILVAQTLKFATAINVSIEHESLNAYAKRMLSRSALARAIECEGLSQK